MRTVTETLPSRGMLYGDKLPGGKIDLRPMTTDEEEILLNARSNRMDTIDLVLQRCIVNEGIEVVDMLNSDRIYLMFAIRNLTYGADYTIVVVCPNCKDNFKITLDVMEDIEVKILTDEDQEISEYEMPSKTVFGLRRLTVKDERDITAFVRQSESLKLKANQSKSPAYTYRLAKHIATIDGKRTTVLVALKLFPLQGRESLALRQAIEDISCGLNLSLKHVCPRCSRQFEETLDFTPEFFRPSTPAFKRRKKDSAPEGKSAG